MSSQSASARRVRRWARTLSCSLPSVTVAVTAPQRASTSPAARARRRCHENRNVCYQPLHLHPHYRDTYDLSPADFPVVTAIWKRLVSLPIFPSITDGERGHVIDTVVEVCRQYRR